MAAARAGDDEALEELCARVLRLFWPMAYRLAGSRDDADDILQEAVIKALRGVARLRTDPAFVGWMRTIVVREAVSRHRLHERRVREVSRDDVLLTLPTRDDDVVSRVAIEDELAALTPHHRWAVVLISEGYSLREAAAELNVSHTTVQRWVASGYAQLRRNLPCEDQD